jgi:hypothetical protein
MAQISYSGSFNAATLAGVPDLYVNVEVADTGNVSPAKTGYVGLVGVASWGYTNKAVQILSARTLSDFGNPTVRAADLVTHAGVIMSAQQASGVGYKLYCVRVTDGTDTAATGTLGGVTLTSFHTGTLGNSTVATLAVGSKSTVAAPTWTVTLQLGNRSEVFPNIVGGSSLWANVAAAINNGMGTLVPASKIVTATATTGYVTAAAPATATLASGTDGAGSVTSSQFAGVDGSTESGIYAFRGLGLTHVVIADFYDDTFMTTLVAFGLSEGILCHTAGTPGEASATAATALTTSGISSPWLKRYVGDWIYYNDTYNGLQRVLAPSTFNAATMSVLQPSESGLNKQTLNVVATQRSRSSNPYSQAELAILNSAGLEVICNPIPAGSMFGARIGLTTSENTSINGDNYPTMTSFLARSIGGAAALGGLIGQVMDDTFYQDGFAILDAFCAGLKADGLIEGYSVKFDASTVTLTQAENGISAAMVLVQYLSIARIILVNLEGGQTVVLPATATA